MQLHLLQLDGALRPQMNLTATYRYNSHVIDQWCEWHGEMHFNN